VTLTPAIKLGVEEFDILAMLGKRCKISSFIGQISQHFWRIISDSEPFNEEVLDCCVQKFAEMVKF